MLVGHAHAEATEELTSYILNKRLKCSFLYFWADFKPSLFPVLFEEKHPVRNVLLPTHASKKGMEEEEEKEEG